MRDFINGRGKWVSDTSAHTGNWNYIKAITDIVINAYTGALEGFVDRYKPLFEEVLAA